MLTGGLALYKRSSLRPPAPPGVDRITIPVKPLDMKVVAVIIDDVGHNRRAARAFIDMEHPVALSILPDRPFSRQIASEAARKGKTVLLHLPMQPSGYPGVDPGPGAVLMNQSSEEIRQVVERDISSLEGIAGVNNHMGSEATADPRVMEAVMEMIDEKGLFFIDSRTTPSTVALAMARERGIPSAKRDVFLDNETAPSAIDARADELLELAEKNGWAVGIGHAHPETARAMERLARRARERNIQWISIESLIAYADTGD